MQIAIYALLIAMLAGELAASFTHPALARRLACFFSAAVLLCGPIAILLWFTGIYAPLVMLGLQIWFALRLVLSGGRTLAKPGIPPRQQAQAAAAFSQTATLFTCLILAVFLLLFIALFVMLLAAMDFPGPLAFLQDIGILALALVFCLLVFCLIFPPIGIAIIIGFAAAGLWIAAILLTLALVPVILGQRAVGLAAPYLQLSRKAKIAYHIAMLFPIINLIPHSILKAKIRMADAAQTQDTPAA